MKIIAHIHTDFPTKFGIPRQSGLDGELEGVVEFVPEFSNPDYVRGIEAYSHLWLLWCFSESAEHPSSPTVRPPRLGGNQRVGVFATRSPFRPNPIGLSSVRLLRVEDVDGGKRLIVSGADLMDGTPIYDIKPYLAFTDSHPDAVGGFSDASLPPPLSVRIDPAFAAKLPAEKLGPLIRILQEDPRPAYQDDPERIYGFPFSGFEIRFRVEGDVLTVVSVDSR